MKQFQFDDGSRDGNALRNCTLHSDRGYMLPAIVFEFLLSNGAHALGTTKQFLGKCWPFTFNQKLSANDRRTSIDPKGAPTLFMKECTLDRNSRRKMFATAFRNGTDKVATAVSSFHSELQWEGIVKHNHELRAYESDKTSLRLNFFQRVNDLFPDERNYEEEELIDSILDEKIVPVTLRQGLSLSSSSPVNNFLFVCIVILILLLLLLLLVVHTRWSSRLALLS